MSAGGKITADSCYRDAVRSSQSHVIRCCGLQGVALMLLVPGPRSRRVWALPLLTWSGGKRTRLWIFSRTALGYPPGLPPVAFRYGLVCAPEGKRRMEAFFCTDPQATPVRIVQWVMMRWSVEVIFEEARAHLGFETQRQWLDTAIACTTPVLLALFSLVTVLALRLSQGGQMPVPATAWYHKGEPTVVDCLALGRRHLRRARYLVNSTAEAEYWQFPREAFERFLTGLSLAA